MRKSTTVIVCFILWFLLVWPFDPITGGFDLPATIVGVAVSVLVGLLLGDKVEEKFALSTMLRRFVWMIIYVPIFLYYMFLANLDVLYRVIHPDMPIRPGIVKVRTNLKSSVARTMLANSITLTPGTLTVDITDDGYLYIHWINVKKDDLEGATKQIVSRFEKILRRAFE